jgi:hypothetical protein
VAKRDTASSIILSDIMIRTVMGLDVNDACRIAVFRDRVNADQWLIAKALEKGWA